MTSTRTPVVLEFKEGDVVVVPGVGVTTLDHIDEQEAAGLKVLAYSLRLRDGSWNRIPVRKAAERKLRPITSEGTLTRAIEALKKKPKTSTQRWTVRRDAFQEKVRSNDLVALAQVIRDTYGVDGKAIPAHLYRIYRHVVEDLFVPELMAILNIDKEAVYEYLKEQTGKELKIVLDTASGTTTTKQEEVEA